MDNKLRELRNRRGLSVKQIADALNITTGYYYKLERGEKRLNVDHLNKLAVFFNASVDYLINIDDREEIFPGPAMDINVNGIIMLPVYGSIAAGFPMQAIQEDGEYMPFDVNLYDFNGHDLDEYFYFRIKGNSMEPTIADKDIVLVHRQPVVENGQVAVVLCDDYENATCKRVTVARDNLILNSDNRDYTPMVHDANKCVIIGKVIGRYGVVK